MKKTTLFILIDYGFIARLALISGGSVTITDSYEGIEGGYVKISGGTITVTSSDDGINAASDDDSIKEYIIISGGDITVNAGGDGIDSNGSVLISGGTLVIHGPVSGADSSLDSETGIPVTGGTLFATSSMGMLETPLPPPLNACFALTRSLLFPRARR